VSPPGYRADVDILNTFPAPAAVARLRAMYVRYVVVNLGQFDDEIRSQVGAALKILPPGVTPVATFESAQVFEIGPEVPRESGELGRADERASPLEQRGVHQAGRLERVEARRDG